MSRIDILVAVFNGEKVIKDCVQSLLETEYPEKGIVIVNDGSTDTTEKILREFGNKIILINQPHQGVAAARNVGIKNCTAEFVALTDADCQAEPSWLKNAMGHFEKPKVGAVTGWLHYKVTNTLSAVREAEYTLRFGRRAPKAYSVSCPVALFRKNVLNEVGGFDSRFIVGGEDTEIGYRIKEKGYEIIYEKKMVCVHAAEEKISTYIKRNFRNGINHLWVLKMRRKKIFFSDDFFPFILRFQPVFTAGLLIFFSLWILFGYYIWGLGFLLCFIFIFANFLPVAVYVSRIKGILSFPYTFTVLAVRNIVWMAALFIGIFSNIKNECSFAQSSR